MYNYLPDELIEEIRASNDIVDVVSEYVGLEKKGKDFFGLCPFHKERTPSFSVVPAKQIFYCFGCGRGGNVIHFIMGIENLEYIESVRLLAERSRIQIPEGKDGQDAERAKLKQDIFNINKVAARFFFNCLNSEKGKEAGLYLKKRGVSQEIIKKFGIGFSPTDWESLYRHLKDKGFDDRIILQSGLVLPGKKGGYYDRFRGRIMFPIFDVRGNVVGFGGRVTDSTLPKYINSPETAVYNKGRTLYGLNFAKNAGENALIIVEGYMDVISLHQYGIINSVASLGTALTESQGRLIKKYAEEIFICYDADSAGQSATLRGLELLNDIGCNVKVLIIPDGKDPDEFIRRNGGKAFRELIEKSVSLLDYKVGLLEKQTNINTTEGKIVFLNRVADLLAKLGNDVEREMYAKKIAGEYGVTADSLYSQVLRRTKPRISIKREILNRSDFKASGKEDSGANTDKKLISDERLILVLLSLDNSIYKKISDKIGPEMFTDSHNKQIAELMFKKLKENRPVEPGELLNMAEKEYTGEFSRIISEHSGCDDILKAILGKIKDINAYKTEKRLREISEILDKQDGLNKGDVEKLKEEFRRLTLEIKEQKNR